jgi:hypothetical protein
MALDDPTSTKPTPMKINILQKTFLTLTAGDKGRTISNLTTRSRKPEGRGIALIAALAAGIFAVALVGAALAQPEYGKDLASGGQDDRQQPQRPPRSVPSLAVYMLAYEAASTGKEGGDPEMVKALNKAFAENPEARETFAMLHKAYQDLPAERRRALVGPELATATAKTRLSRDVIKRSLFTRTSVARSAATFTKLPGSEKAPARTKTGKSKPESLEAKDPEGLPPALRLNRKDDEQIGEEVKEGQSSLYRVTYKGMYLTDENDDWGTSCEPYVIFVMHQKGKTWTRRAGPFSMDDGSKSFKEIDLRSKTPFGVGTIFGFEQWPLQVTALGWENDSWDPKAVQNAVAVAVETGCDVAKSEGVNCTDKIENLATDALNWFVGLFANDDDQVGPPKEFTIDLAFAKSHEGSTTDPDSGHVKDFWLLFDGDGDKQWGDEYRYWVAIDVIPIN